MSYRNVVKFCKQAAVDFWSSGKRTDLDFDSSRFVKTVESQTVTVIVTGTAGVKESLLGLDSWIAAAEEVSLQTASDSGKRRAALSPSTNASGFETGRTVRRADARLVGCARIQSA